MIHNISKTKEAKAAKAINFNNLEFKEAS